MLAPGRLVAWMAAYEHVDRRFGHVYRYHSRSDAHSIALCRLVLGDLLQACSPLQAQARRGEVVYGINAKYLWPSTGKAKTLDLAVGLSKEAVDAGEARTIPLLTDLAPAPSRLPDAPEGIRRGELADVLVSCEAKSVMTEHGKSKPRVYDELSSSHEIVHQGRPDALASGITVVNIAESFVSPLRQTTPESLYVSKHRQPGAAAGMVQHLRGLPIRDEVGQVGFDAYATIVVETDNQGTVRLWIAPPAPQPGDRDHYETFLQRLSTFYADRFGVNPGPH